MKAGMRVEGRTGGVDMVTGRQAAGKLATIPTWILGDTGLPGQGLARELRLLPHSSPLISASAQYWFHSFVLQFLPARELVSPLWVSGGSREARSVWWPRGAGNARCVGNCWHGVVRGQFPKTVALGPRLLWLIFLRLVSGRKWG